MKSASLLGNLMLVEMMLSVLLSTGMNTYWMWLIIKQVIRLLVKKKKEEKII